MALRAAPPRLMSLTRPSSMTSADASTRTSAPQGAATTGGPWWNRCRRRTPAWCPESTAGAAARSTPTPARTAAMTRSTWFSASAAVASTVARSALPTASRSCAATAGQSSSRSLRCRSAHRRQLVIPGTTSGPTSPAPSRTRTGRCGILPSCRSRSSRGSATRNPTARPDRSSPARRRRGLAAVLDPRARAAQRTGQQVRQRPPAVDADRRRPGARREASRSPRARRPARSTRSAIVVGVDAAAATSAAVRRVDAGLQGPQQVGQRRGGQP